MKSEIREAPINIRAKTSQRDLIDMAANLVSKSRTDFVLDAACREAQDILLDQRLFILDDKQYDAFLAELDAPITQARQAKIDDLMSRKSPWE
ncbi:TPA: DUF1778 domain-containing protein [Salmonella enterica]|uniref:DUF1778 domain-containing protein n=1 Tax=Salmonella enterica TaxID=28901 RepID=A0A747TWG2_SALER|nr:DUF1778 domain-containing protein [Salmonella enterica subsp. enterica]EAR7456902.1 DUF1778 domain-containing protein [Salmonella enterica]EBQ9892727.1 hypothetical protein [Salmonella enterica subsp. enterica serovar Hvittingfoss]EBS2857856.1 DUF1778 domain-containing protein [Salmonella enterica subsp. enterica serovar Richmond]EBS4510189.1 DUF1778 domain-containing protein [Salmonella enterica subsp. enterica serovar Adamstua]EBW4541745.1 DUF1778 domain-containing protein [Salmonella ent